MPDPKSKKSVMQWAVGLERRAKKLVRSASYGRISLSDFREQFPRISDQVSKDAKSNVWSLWYNSWNFDENARKVIVDRKLLRCLCRLIGQPQGRSNVYHAGLLHTYGYLLSTIETPFGKKADRWTEGQVAKLLNQELVQLTPLTQHGTMLQNLTNSLLTIVSQFGFKNPSVPRELSAVPKFETAWKIQESIQFQGQRLEFQTALVVPVKPKSRDYLCVYWLNQSRVSKLVTCFPMKSENAKELLEQPTGSGQMIRPRFNAAVDDWPKRSCLPGTRKVIGFG